MSNEIIKEFVKKQTSPLHIGIPRQENIKAASEESGKAKVGRPKAEGAKTKISIYVPEEVKDKLFKYQHDKYRRSLNDVIIEAIADFIEKNNL